MLQPVAHVKDGFTLIEFLVALLIMTVGLLGLLKSVNVSIMQNSSNKNRNFAVTLADQVATNDHARPFADISSTSRLVPVRSGLGFVNYSVAKSVSSPTTTTKNITLRIKWREKGKIKEQQMTTLISQ